MLIHFCYIFNVTPNRTSRINTNCTLCTRCVIKKWRFHTLANVFCNRKKGNSQTIVKRNDAKTLVGSESSNDVQRDAAPKYITFEPNYTRPCHTNLHIALDKTVTLSMCLAPAKCGAIKSMLPARPCCFGRFLNAYTWPECGKYLYAKVGCELCINVKM